METSNLARKTMEAARLAALDAMERGSSKQGYDIRAFRQALVRVVRSDSQPNEALHAE